MQRAQAVEFAGTSFERGTRTFWHLACAETVTGPLMVPITTVAGARSGPTLAVTAGCHPGEYNGILSSVEFAQRLDPAALSGQVVVVHVQNVPAVQAKVGHVSPVDGVNMGRAYPVPGEVVEEVASVSHQSQSPTHQIADTLMEQIIGRSDAHVDLHGGEHFEELHPNIEYLITGQSEIDERTRELGRSFGFSYLWEVPYRTIPQMPSYPDRGASFVEAPMRGIPSVLCEVGGEGRIEQSLVDLTVDGLLRVLAHRGMIASAPDGGIDDPEVLVGGQVLFANRAGLFVSEVAAGEPVDEGQRLGRLVALDGEVVETFSAPVPARMLNVVRRGVANPGDMLFVMGNRGVDPS